MRVICVVFYDALQAAELRALVQRNQRHALGGAAHFADFTDPRAHQHTAVGDQHDFIVRVYQRGSHHPAVALGLLDGNHPLGATAVACVLCNVGALAVAVFGGGQYTGAGRFRPIDFGGSIFCHQHGNHALAVLQVHAAHAARIAAHGTHIVLGKAHRLAVVAEQHHVVCAIGQRRADQVVAFVQVDSNDAALARVGKIVQRSLFDSAHAGGHEHIAVCREAAHVACQRQHDVDLLAFLQWEHVDDWTPARATRACWHLPNLEPVQPATVGKAQDVVVRVGNEKLVNPVVFFCGGGLLAATATLLCTVLGEWLAFDVSRVAERDHHVGGRDQVFGGQVLRAVLDQAAACTQLGLAKLGFHRGQLVANDGGNARRRGQNVQQVCNDRHHILVLGHDLVLFQAGQALQAHLQNLLGLRVRQAVQAVLPHAEFPLQPFGAVVVSVHSAAIGARAGQHLAHHGAVPAARHQRALGHRRGGRIADDGNEIVNVGQRHCQAFKHMAAVARLAQFKHRAARDDLTSVLQKDADQRFQIAQAGLAVDQRHHVHAKSVLQLRLLVQVVEHHFGHFTTLEFDHQAHARLVGLVLNVADAFEFFLVHQLGHALLQRFLVDLVRQFVNDDRLALAAVDVLEMALGAHDDAAPAGAVTVFHTGDAINDAGGRKVGRRNDLHQFIDGGFRVRQQVQAAVHHFVQVVRWNIGRHAHGNARGAIDQQVG